MFYHTFDIWNRNDKEFEFRFITHTWMNYLHFGSNMVIWLAYVILERASKFIKSWNKSVMFCLSNFACLIIYVSKFTLSLSKEVRIVFGSENNLLFSYVEYPTELEWEDLRFYPSLLIQVMHAKACCYVDFVLLLFSLLHGKNSPGNHKLN